MSISYIGPAKLGDVITIESTGLKNKGSVRFADVRITNEDGKLIAEASHIVKAFDGSHVLSTPSTPHAEGTK